MHVYACGECEMNAAEWETILINYTNVEYIELAVHYLDALC